MCSATAQLKQVPYRNTLHSYAHDHSDITASRRHHSHRAPEVARPSRSTKCAAFLSFTKKKSLFFDT